MCTGILYPYLYITKIKMNMRFSYYIFILFLFFKVNVFASPDKKLMNDESCPQFHFSLSTPHLSDQNSLVYSEGVYHLFYRNNDLKKGNKNWKHSVSRDLLHWDSSPLEAVPGESIGTKDSCIKFSGSVIVDKNNITGLREGDSPVFICFYTDNKFCQKMAYSTDDGCTWEKYDTDPLIPYRFEENAENPKVFWYKPGNKYIMLISRKPDGDENLKGVSIYSSLDLLKWKYESHLPLDVRNPDLFCLPVNDSKTENRWIMTGYDGSYFIGEFDGHIFTPKFLRNRLDYGTDYFYPMVCDGLPENDGRIIQIGWINGGRDPKAYYNSQMAFPCELSLKKVDDKIKLIRKPISEISLLNKKESKFENKNVIPGLNKNILRGIKGDCLHIKGTFDIKTANTFALYLKYSSNKAGIDINYDIKGKKINCFNREVTLSPEDGKIKLEILLDRTSVEVFFNDGEIVITKGMVPDSESNGLYLYNTGGELFIDNLQINSIRSVYDKKK